MQLLEALDGLDIQFLDVDETLRRADAEFAVPRLWYYSGQYQGDLFNASTKEWGENRQLRPHDYSFLIHQEIPSDNPTIARVIERFRTEYAIGEPREELSLMTTAENRWDELSAQVQSSRMPLQGPEAFRQAILKAADESERAILYAEKHKHSREFAEAFLNLRDARNAYAQASGFTNYYEMMLQRRFEITPSEADSILARLEQATAPYMNYVETNMLPYPGSANVTSYNHSYYRARFIASLFPDFHNLTYSRVMESITKLFSTLGFRNEFQTVYIDDSLRSGKGLAGCIPVERLPREYTNAFVLFDRTVMTVENVTDIIHEIFHGVHTASMDGRLLYILRKWLERDAIWAEMPGLLSEEYVPDIVMSDGVSKEALEQLEHANTVAQMTRWMTSILTLRLEQYVYEHPQSSMDDINAYYLQIQKKLYSHILPPSTGVYEWAGDIYPWKYPVYSFGHIIAGHIAKRIKQYGERSFGSIRNKQFGSWLKEELFRPGYAVPWRQLLFQTTGEEFTPDSYSIFDEEEN